MNPLAPLIVQSDHTLLLEVQNPEYTACRDFLVSFAELVKSPEFMHTYRTTPLSLWNAAALGIEIESILDNMTKFSKYPLPAPVIQSMTDWYQQYGKLVLEKSDDEEYLLLTVTDDYIFDKITHDDALKSFWYEYDTTEKALVVRASDRGNVKHALIKAGYPVNDLCGYIKGEQLEIALRDVTLEHQKFSLRDYQLDAIDAFYQNGRNAGGNGIIVLPCGSGKTIIGVGTMACISNHTLIVTTNTTSVHQWRHEILQKTHLTEDHVGEYIGGHKEIKPITITTYQMLTYRASKYDPMNNMKVFTQRNWGLIIYDEVHTLPAPVFRATTAIQAKRRLGLTATLVREDGLEDDVFALIGPKRYDVPWKVLEARGYIAEANCIEYRVPFCKTLEKAYAFSDKRSRYRIAAENKHKITLVKDLLKKHAKDQVLIIGQYISQLDTIKKALNVEIITGKTSQQRREVLYQQFKSGELSVLLVSKVANFAVDLPDANVLIQVSGTYGSRQEEAQRLGRILRPKSKPSHFYTLVTKNSDEQDFSQNRQMFLVEQGYQYNICYYEQ